ncbi:GTP 3',8-cyclase MoaA [Mucilaginibacter pallidiroseus]|uniref:GTP 3',8-cyclase n=1 Tax=Mucilaginibacter pallidiroseus TaxID=2599295 RepID=A0A563U8A2_9SPHI|nr:GTP 3',8-cyclase MoaA [Mucilaginibacter pallidiroseus]TWR27519.1 GTP 3',8-cyclase MoaA [Mucilaginibacter pallidiroseus]
MLTDNHGRTISYLRLAVTDRCNLRCFYCMPEHGLDWLSRTELMSNAEMLRICSLLVKMGIDKIRITGGEPFVRKDIMELLTSLSQLKGLKDLSITTNGILTAPFVPQLKALGVKSVNLSLDTLDANRFFTITRRDEFDAVMLTLDTLLSHGIEVKINTVVMAGKNTQDIPALVALTKDRPVSVRFIEEMPFNGEGHDYSGVLWNHLHILQEIKNLYPDLQKTTDTQFSTAYNYQVPGHTGSVGIIAAYSRTFCGTCNRIRLTPSGMLKNCLYDDGVLNIKDHLRAGTNDEQLEQILLKAFNNREIDGWAAAEKRIASPNESMASIGG